MFRGDVLGEAVLYLLPAAVVFWYHMNRTELWAVRFFLTGESGIGDCPLDPDLLLGASIFEVKGSSGLSSVLTVLGSILVRSSASEQSATSLKHLVQQ